MGRVLARFEDKGLNVIAMKLIRVTPELAKRHYAEHFNMGWYPDLEAFVTSSPLVAAIVEGPEAIRVIREMVGATESLQAAPGTIRGDYVSFRQACKSFDGVVARRVNRWKVSRWGPMAG